MLEIILDTYRCDGYNAEYAVCFDTETRMFYIRGVGDFPMYKGPGFKNPDHLILHIKGLYNLHKTSCFYYCSLYALQKIFTNSVTRFIMAFFV